VTQAKCNVMEIDLSILHHNGKVLFPANASGD